MPHTPHPTPFGLPTPLMPRACLFLTGADFPSQAEVEWDTEAMRLLEEAIESTEITFLNEPREGKKLLVLDLDSTLFDMKSVGWLVGWLVGPFGWLACDGQFAGGTIFFEGGVDVVGGDRVK